jgi:hypothetical protein
MAQSLANILIHIIFSTKKRQPMIVPEIIQELYSYMAGIARAHESQVGLVAQFSTTEISEINEKV